MQKNVGTRPRAKVRTPEQHREHRARQAARAILAGRNREANWARIERYLRDIPERRGYVLDLQIPEAIVARVWPTPPAPEQPAEQPAAAA